jgi:predicted acylesterase/phospholipase RssA
MDERVSPRKPARREGYSPIVEREGHPLLRPDESRPLGMVLSGGGARGAFQAGVWKALATHPRGIIELPQIISGTSAGAINAMLIACHKSPEEIMEFWLDLARQPPVRANESFFTSLRRVLSDIVLAEPLRGFVSRGRDARKAFGTLRQHNWFLPSGIQASVLEHVLTARFDAVSRILDGIHSTHLFDTEELGRRLKAAVGGEVIPKTDIRLAINCVDARSGEVVRVVNYHPQSRTSARNYRFFDEIPVDMVLASASIPLIFNPVVYNNMTLWDGGLLVNSPMAPAIALGAGRILPVLVTSEPAPGVSAPMDSIGQCIERVIDVLLENAYNADRKLMLERNELANNMPQKRLRRVQLFTAIRPQASELFNAGSYLFFERDNLLSMYEAGVAAGRHWIEKVPKIDAGLYSGQSVKNSSATG